MAEDQSIFSRLAASIMRSSNIFAWLRMCFSASSFRSLIASSESVKEVFCFAIIVLLCGISAVYLPYKSNAIMETEIWKDIDGFEGHYQVSNLGQIRSLDRFIKDARLLKRFEAGQIIPARLKNNGYLHVRLSKDGVHKFFLVHRIVAKTFISNPNNLPEVNHKKGIKTDNRASELEWATSKENTQHSIANGLTPKVKRGAENKNSKPILQMDMNHNIIKVFPNAREAEKETGASNKNIAACARGKAKSAKGFLWRYAT